jgi:ribonucleotide reductase beta subunit family protein with ferritin-like domain
MSIFNDTITYRPFTYPWAMELTIEHGQALYWETHQIEMIDDIRQYHADDGLDTDNVPAKFSKNLLNKSLAIFTQMDMSAGGLYRILMPHVKNNEVANMMMTFAQKESVHQRAYAMGVEVLDMPESTWGEFMEYKEMSDKIDLMTNVDGRDHSKPLDFAKTLAQLLLAEGICLFGAFACMLNLKRFGLMMGLNMINEWSLRDEERHVYGNMLVLDEVRKELTDEENEELTRFIVNLVQEYRNAEHRFIELVFEMGPVEDMTEQNMKDYIDYLCDLRLRQLGLGDIYKMLINPLEWMNYVLGGKQHTNFFEAKVGEYSHTGLPGNVDYSNYKKKKSF